jgi:hypothetical protein
VEEEQVFGRIMIEFFNERVGHAKDIAPLEFGVFYAGTEKNVAKYEITVYSGLLFLCNMTAHAAVHKFANARNFVSLLAHRFDNALFFETRVSEDGEEFRPEAAAARMAVDWIVDELEI